MVERSRVQWMNRMFHNRVMNAWYLKYYGVWFIKVPAVLCNINAVLTYFVMSINFQYTVQPCLVMYEFYRKCLWIKSLTSNCRSSIFSPQPEFGQRTVRDKISLLAKLSGKSWSSDSISLSTGHRCPVSLVCKRKNTNYWGKAFTVFAGV